MFSSLKVLLRALTSSKWQQIDLNTRLLGLNRSGEKYWINRTNVIWFEQKFPAHNKYFEFKEAETLFLFDSVIFLFIRTNGL